MLHFGHCTLSCPWMKFVQITTGRYSVTRSNSLATSYWGYSSPLVIALVIVAEWQLKLTFTVHIIE